MKDCIPIMNEIIYINCQIKNFCFSPFSKTNIPKFNFTCVFKMLEPVIRCRGFQLSVIVHRYRKRDVMLWLSGGRGVDGWVGKSGLSSHFEETQLPLAKRALPVGHMEKAMARHSSTLAWKIPWMEEPGRLQSMGSLSRTRLSNFTFTFHFPASEKEMATHSSVLAWRIPGTGKPGELPSMGSQRVGHD